MSSTSTTGNVATATSAPTAEELNVEPKVLTETERKKIIKQVCSRNYEEQVFTSEDRKGKVSILHDKGIFSKEIIEGFLNLSKSVRKEICLVSWVNNEAIKYVRTKRKKRKNIYFFLFGEPELDSCYASPFGSDQKTSFRYYVEGKPKHYHFWVQKAQILDYKDFEKVFEMQFSEHNGISFTGTHYEFSVYRDVAISLSSFIMGNIPSVVANSFISTIMDYSRRVIAQPRITKEKVSAIVNRFVDNYRDFTALSLKNVQKTLERKVNDSLERMRINYQEIIRAEKVIKATNDEITMAMKNLESFSTKFEEGKTKLVNLARGYFKTKFSDFEVGADYLWVRTKPIIIKCVLPADRGGDGTTEKAYLIGEFKIKIAINDGFVHLENLTNPFYHSNSRFDHPHVNNRIPCLGNLKEVVPKMINKGEYFDLFLLMHDFLTSLNPYGWYPHAPIYKWPVVENAYKRELHEEIEEQNDEEPQNQEEIETQAPAI